MRYRLAPQRRYRQQRPRFVGGPQRDTLSLLGVTRAPVAGRVRLSYASETFSPDVGATLWDQDHFYQLADLSLARSRQWFDPYNDTGNASLVLQNDDPDLDLAGIHNIVDFTYRGEHAASMIIETLERKQIDPDEEAGQFTTVGGRLHVAALERAVIYPTLGTDNLPVETSRNFNWTSPFYDDSGWGMATNVTDVATAKGIGWWPADYPDDAASILWAHDGTTGATPAGHCYFRTVINSGLTVPAKVVLCGDNSAQLAIDGVLVASTGFFPDIAEERFDLSAGLHVVSVQCENLSADGPGGVAFSIYGTDIYGNVTALGWNSQAAYTKIVEYAADPPGITAGFALLEVVADLQARGMLSGLTTTFTETADSRGEPWPLVNNITTQIGNSTFAFLQEMAAAGYIDYWMTPAMFELNACIGGTRGT